MNDEALLEIYPPERQGFAPLGEVLSAARKAKKLSEQDVSNNLRLSIKQISDIENNDFSTLPQPMITRGFIRNYARLLELDAEPLLDSYRARMPDKTPKSLAVQSSMYQVVSGKESQPWLKYILGSILILLFLLAWIFYIDYMPKPAKSPVEKAPGSVTTAPPVTELALPEIALPAAERQAEPSEVIAGTDSGTATSTVNLPAESASNEASPSANTSMPASNASVTNAPASETAKAANPVAPAAASKNNTAVDFNTLKEKSGQNATPNTPVNTVKPQAAVVSSAPEVAPAQTQKVSVSITEKTWIQATDKSGKVVYERILPAGSSDGFDGQPPFIVVIGNAKATKLTFLGKPVDLASSTTQNNVARIKLE